MGITPWKKAYLVGDGKLRSFLRVYAVNSDGEKYQANVDIRSLLLVISCRGIDGR